MKRLRKQPTIQCCARLWFRNGSPVNRHTDVAIVGAGIMGLAHAYHAACKGLSVTVIERSSLAQGASIRNFGMLAIVAQAEGSQLDSARRGLKHWQRVASCADIALQQTGCLFVAREQQELQVLDEFVRIRQNQSAQNQFVRRGVSGDHTTGERMLRRADVARYTAMSESAGLLGGAWSDDAWKLDQRSAVAKLALWLQREHDVQFYFESEVTAVSSVGVCAVELQLVSADHSASGSAGKHHVHRCNHAIVCGGHEFSTLFPEVFAQTGVSYCELQMLRTVAQPGNWQLKPFILGGLSVTRYSAFQCCPSLSALVELQQTSQSEYLRHGIHLIACQEIDGSITIGDSHKYGIRCSPQRSTEIDDLILSGLRRLITLPDMRIAQRWLGYYAHLPGSDVLTLSPVDGVTVKTVTNGQGMTHAFALAEDFVAELTA